MNALRKFFSDIRLRWAEPRVDYPHWSDELELERELRRGPVGG